MVRLVVTAAVLGALVSLSGLGVAVGASGTPIQVYGAWHCSNDACTWGTARTVGESIR